MKSAEVRNRVFRAAKAAGPKNARFYREVVRPGGFELPTFWFVASRGQNPNGLFGVAYEF